MNKTFPGKLKAGDEIRIIAPSGSLAMISAEQRAFANKRFEDIGLKVSFSKNAEETDDSGLNSIESRVEDLHKAFTDKNIKAVLTVIGGFNSNQLLRYIDWNLIKKNPKIFCGFSDITALNNAIFAKTGLVTYSGPHYSTFSQKLHFDYTLEYFKICLFSKDPFNVLPSKEWSDNKWYLNQEKRDLIENKGFLIINEGNAEGTILGANLCTFNLLQGTEYFPDLKDSILFLEDDYESKPHNFDRDLQSLIHLLGFSGISGIVIGRFQKASQITDVLLTKIIKSKKELNNIPVIANVDFGHTDPKITFPIGGTAKISAGGSRSIVEITKH